MARQVPRPVRGASVGVLPNRRGVAFVLMYKHRTPIVAGLPVAILVAACSGLGTQTSGRRGDPDTPWWILIVVAVALVVLIVAFVSRGNRDRGPKPLSELTWKEHARAGYVEARWLYDAMTEDIAVWRGNSGFGAKERSASADGTSAADTWSQLSVRLDRARESLYALDVAAPDRRAGDAAVAVVEAMLEVRSSLDVRAEARVAYREAEAEETQVAGLLIAARDREIRASTKFNSARTTYARALTALSDLA